MIPRWFEESLITRGTEIDRTATVGMNVFLRYFEHLRWRLMVTPELGLSDLIHAGHFFVVRAQTVELRRRVGQGVRLNLFTRFGRVGRSTAEVFHEARLADDAVVARARVLGVWLGPARAMVRLPDAFRDGGNAQAARDAGEPQDPGSAGSEPARIVAVHGGFAASFTAPPTVVLGPLALDVDAPRSPPAPAIFEHELIVPPRDLDVFGHVNAATWLAYVDDVRHLAGERGAVDREIAHGYVARAALFYAREACVHDRLRIALVPLETANAFGAWFFRDPEPEALCSVRIDLAPGARLVTAPRA